jgi:hypothetical protein
MENLKIYEASRQCPAEAQKVIQGGRLKGKTDINPMWRIKKLTELFGPCGFGWVTEIRRQWIDGAPCSNERIANVEIALRVKVDGKWSEPIVGIGGAMFISNEANNKIYVDDECYKKAYTDAISVACKALGMAADIYWSTDPTKYDAQRREAAPVVKVLRESFFDNRERLDNMLAQMVEYYREKPDSFTILRFLERNNVQCESDAVMARLREIWMQHISELGL